ncbi:hypothetical protein ACHAWU_002314 [Discostella pseudostelligera]|uniref:ADP,ATP carrier protein n=1 Tax=Discostella pseudostelligera TaxID=259834 RepID=A0ABD3MTW5_9STRA
MQDSRTPTKSKSRSSQSISISPTRSTPLRRPRSSSSSSMSMSTTTTNNNNNNNNNRGMLPTLRANSRLLFSIRGKSILYMSLSLAIHLAGYELSRASVMALFTSDRLGFGKSDDNSSASGASGGGGGALSALPMAVGCVSPFSIGLLWFYGKTLHSGGPCYALRIHTWICAAMQIMSGWILISLDNYLNLTASSTSIEATATTTTTSPTSPGFYMNAHHCSQSLLFLLFVFQNSYVQLLYNQHWAFLSSILTPDEGSTFFAPIAGLGSIGSTVAAGLVSILISKIGLIGLLYAAGASYIVSATLADWAFGLARRGGFEPIGGGVDGIGKGNNPRMQSTTTSASSTTTATSASSTSSTTQNRSEVNSECSPISYCSSNNNKGKNSIFQQAYLLFQRVPVLGALFIEVIVSQCLSSLVNFIYLFTLKSTITDDALRAGWSGNFYAWINGVSGFLQFFAIPILLRHWEAHRIWLFMPTLMLCCTSYTFATYRTTGLAGASASFFAIKTMEYSLRGAANEMLYVSLDYESRYLGKKVISLIAGKFGKSVMAVALSLVMVLYGEEKEIMWYLLATATVFTFLWLFASMSLHTLIEASKK